MRAARGMLNSTCCKSRRISVVAYAAKLCRSRWHGISGDPQSATVSSLPADEVARNLIDLSAAQSLTILKIWSKSVSLLQELYRSRQTNQHTTHKQQRSHNPVSGTDVTLDIQFSLSVCHYITLLSALLKVSSVNWRIFRVVLYLIAKCVASVIHIVRKLRENTQK